MKKILVILGLLFCTSMLFAQSSTPNIGLQIPATGSNNWYIPLNYNFTKIDQLLSGNLPIPNLNVTGNINAGSISITGGGGFLTGSGANNYSLPYFSGTTPTKNISYLSFSGLPCYSTTAIPSACTYTQLVHLWASGSCTGYLKSDGTCDAGGTPTAASITALIKTQTGCNIDNQHFWNPFTSTCILVSGGGLTAPVSLNTQVNAQTVQNGLSYTSVYGKNYVDAGQGTGIIAYLKNEGAINIAWNKSTFSDSSTFFFAAQGTYNFDFIGDFFLSETAAPYLFTNSDVLNQITKFLAHTNGSNEIPIYMNQNLSTISYYSGADLYMHHATPDGAWGIPILEMEYFNRLVNAGTAPSTAITQFNTDATKIVAALNAIQMDSTTNCPKVVPNDERATFGFQDAVRSTGAVSIDCVYYAHAAQIVAYLYGVAGNTGAQTTWTTNANNAIAGLSTSSALWDATDGMLYSGTINNNTNINVAASVLAVHYGLVTTAQATAIGNYIAANFATLNKTGFQRQSPTNWTWLGVLGATGGPVSGAYANDSAHPGNNGKGGGTYDDGYWTWFYQSFVEALINVGRGDLAAQVTSQFYYTPDPLLEFLPQTGVSPGQQATHNLETPMGPLGSVLEFPGLNNAQPIYDHVPTACTVTGQYPKGIDASGNAAGCSIPYTLPSTIGVATGGAFVIGGVAPCCSFDGAGNVWQHAPAGNTSYVIDRDTTAYYANFLFATGSSSLAGGYDFGYHPSDSNLHLYDRANSRDQMVCVPGAGCQFYQVKLTSIASQCLNADSGGTITGSGSPCGGATAPTVVGYTFVTGTSSSVASVTTPSYTPTVGNVIYAFCSGATNSKTITSSVAETYTKLTGTANAAPSGQQASWTVVANAGARTFTCTPPSSEIYVSLIVLEISGTLGTINSSVAQANSSANVLEYSPSTTTSQRTFNVVCDNRASTGSNYLSNVVDGAFARIAATDQGAAGNVTAHSACETETSNGARNYLQGGIQYGTSVVSNTTLTAFNY